jgi:hypothetical protein
MGRSANVKPRVSKGLRTPCGMRFTSYMDACSRRLTTRAEWPTDKWIEPLVRIQALNARVAETFGYFDPDIATIRGEAAVRLAVGSFQRELNSFRELYAGMFAGGDGSVSLTLEIRATEAWISEAVFHNNVWNSPTRQTTHSVTSEGPRDAQQSRIEMLWRLVEFHDDFIHSFLAAPDEQLSRYSFATYSKLCYALISLARVAFALLDIQEAYMGCAGVNHVRDEGSTAPALAVESIGYEKRCLSLIKKFDSVESHLRSVSGQSDQSCEAMRHLSLLTKSMMTSYTQRVKRRIARTSRLPDSGASHGMGETSASSGAARDMTTTVPPMSANTGTEISGGWSELSPDSMEGVIDFDEKTWEDMLSAFTLPPDLGNAASDWPVG